MNGNSRDEPENGVGYLDHSEVGIGKSNCSRGRLHSLGQPHPRFALDIFVCWLRIEKIKGKISHSPQEKPQ